MPHRFTRLIVSVIGVAAVLAGARAVDAELRRGEVSRSASAASQSRAAPTSPPSTDARRDAPNRETEPASTMPAFVPDLRQYGLLPIAEKPELQRGDDGVAVEYLQAVLRYEVGHDEVEVDGLFGPATEAAVSSLQIFVGAAGTGVVDQNTWVVIDRLALDS